MPAILHSLTSSPEDLVILVSGVTFWVIAIACSYRVKTRPVQAKLVLVLAFVLLLVVVLGMVGQKLSRGIFPE